MIIGAEGAKLDQGYAVWFTGLPGAGKSTLAESLADLLRRQGLRVEVLDGDLIREGLSKDLGFSKEDRDTNVRRIGFVCELLTRNGVVAIVAVVSPYREVREEVRAMTGNFVEVFVKCPIEVLVKRDVKGMYQKALMGEIQNFTGISDPYEEPLNPEVTVETDKETVAVSLVKVVAKLEELGYNLGRQENWLCGEEHDEVPVDQGGPS